MAEFLAIHVGDAALLPCVLRRLGGRIALGDGERAAGVGSVQSDDVLLRKRPLSSQAFAEQLAQGVESEAALITAGTVTTNSPRRGFDEEATLPFRYKRWLFSIAGAPDALAPAKGALFGALPDYLRRGAKGDSAAEALFLTFLARLRETGQLEDHSLEGPAAARALAHAVGAAERASEQAGQPLPPLAAVVTNGRVLGAVRRGAPLATLQIDGLPECARCEIGPGASDLDPRVRAHRVLRAVLLAGGVTPEGFTPAGDGALLSVSRNLELHAA